MNSSFKMNIIALLSFLVMVISVVTLYGVGVQNPWFVSSIVLCGAWIVFNLLLDGKGYGTVREVLVVFKDTSSVSKRRLNALVYFFIVFGAAFSVGIYWITFHFGGDSAVAILNIVSSLLLAIQVVAHAWFERKYSEEPVTISGCHMVTTLKQNRKRH